MNVMEPTAEMGMVIVSPARIVPQSRAYRTWARIKLPGNALGLLLVLVRIEGTVHSGGFATNRQAASHPT